MPSGAEGVPEFIAPAPRALDGPFRENIEQLLRSHGFPVHLELPGVSAWYIPLLDETGEVCVHLQVYREELDEYAIPICDACRNMGTWVRDCLNKQGGKPALLQDRGIRF